MSLSGGRGTSTLSRFVQQSQQLMPRDSDRQVAEVQVRVAIRNGYTVLGILAR